MEHFDDRSAGNVRFDRRLRIMGWIAGAAWVALIVAAVVQRHVG